MCSPFLHKLIIFIEVMKMFHIKALSMQKLLLIFLLCGPTYFCASDLFLIDTIKAVVFADDGAEIIMQSELDLPSLTGQMQPLEDLIFECRVYLNAKKRKISPDEDGVDAYLRQIQRDNNLTDAALRDIFTASGYTFEEGRQKLQMMQTVNIMLDHEIRSNLIVSRKAAQSYYKEHLPKVEATYALERAFVPFLKKTPKERQFDILKRFAATGKGVQGIEWSESFTVTHSEIAQDKQYIYDMKVGEISQPHELEDGFELFRLIKKTDEYVQSFDEAYREIAAILRRPKYEELMQLYREKLFETASIVYF